MSGNICLTFDKESSDGKTLIGVFDKIELCLEKDSGRIHTPQINTVNVPLREPITIDLNYTLQELIKILHVAFTAHIEGSLKLYLDNKFLYWECRSVNKGIRTKIITDWILGDCNNDYKFKIITPGKRLTIGKQRKDIVYTVDKPILFQSVQGPLIKQNVKFTNLEEEFSLEVAT